MFCCIRCGEGFDKPTNFRMMYYDENDRVVIETFVGCEKCRKEIIEVMNQKITRPQSTEPTKA